MPQRSTPQSASKLAQLLTREKWGILLGSFVAGAAGAAGSTVFVLRLGETAPVEPRELPAETAEAPSELSDEDLAKLSALLEKHLGPREQQETADGAPQRDDTSEPPLRGRSAAEALAELELAYRELQERRAEDTLAEPEPASLAVAPPDESQDMIEADESWAPPPQADEEHELAALAAPAAAFDDSDPEVAPDAPHTTNNFAVVHHYTPIWAVAGVPDDESQTDGPSSSRSAPPPLPSGAFFSFHAPLAGGNSGVTLSYRSTNTRSRATTSSQRSSTRSRDPQSRPTRRSSHNPWAPIDMSNMNNPWKTGRLP